MNTNPFKATKDFFEHIVAVKAPSVYLPGYASRSPVSGNVMPSKANAIVDERRALSLRILRRAGVRIPPPFTHIYEQEEVSRTMGARLVRDLVNSGYMQVYQYHPSRRGGAIKIPRVLDPGWLELSQFGTERPEQVLGGGWDHDLCGKVVGAIGKRQNYRDSYEVLIGPEKDVRIDVVLEAVNKPRLYCQCCFSSASREVETAVRALSIIPVEAGRLLLVCRDKAIANTISRLLKKEDNYKQLQERILIKLFGDLLEYYHKRYEGGDLL
jgi:hypothetical protein